MRKLDEMPAMVLSADLTHGRTGDPIRFRAIILEHHDGRYFIEYSHAPRPSGDAGFWYSDSLTSAGTYDEAREHVDAMCNELESAFEVRPW